MSDTDTVTSTPETNTVTQTAPKYRVGYIVAVQEDGELAFHTFGGSVGMIELLGLHKFADTKMTQILDANQGTGETILRRILQTVVTTQNGAGGATSVDGK